MSWSAIADRAIEHRGIDRDDAHAVVHASDDDLLPIMQAAFRVRRHFHGRQVKVHRLRNAKSGICPEDCSFCSQAARFGTVGHADRTLFLMRGVNRHEGNDFRVRH